MIRVAICDDQPDQLQRIWEECAAYFAQNRMYTAQITAYEKPAQLLDGTEKAGGCDLALLDIRMPGLDGLAVARELRQRSKQTEIIFMTASAEYAMEAYSVHALEYLLKPVSSAAFQEAMDRAMARFGPDTRKQLLIHGESSTLHTVCTDEIAYIESFRNYRSICTCRGVFRETKRTLTALLEELERSCPGQFISPYRGYIVNLDAISTIAPDGITLKDGKTILIKPGSFRKLRDIYFNYAFNRKR